MPFFHQNLSPLTRRHGYKIPDFEVDFRPKTVSSSSSPSNASSSSTSNTSSPQPSDSAEERKKRNRKSKLKPDYFWTAPAPVWKMGKNYRIEKEHVVVAEVPVATEEEDEIDPFRASIYEWRDKVESDSASAATEASSTTTTTTTTRFRMSANRAWEFSCPEFEYGEVEERDGREC